MPRNIQKQYAIALAKQLSEQTGQLHIVAKRRNRWKPIRAASSSAISTIVESRNLPALAAWLRARQVDQVELEEMLAQL